METTAFVYLSLSRDSMMSRFFAQRGGAQRQAAKDTGCNVRRLLGIEETRLVALNSAERGGFIVHAPAAPEGGHATPAEAEISPATGEVFRNCETGELFPFGQFSTFSVEDFQRFVDKMPPAAVPARCKLETLGPHLDIGEFQATLTTADRAMVQVASNFNCLEVPAVEAVPNGGSLIDTACYDHTQGPAAVFGPLTAYLYRAHFCFSRPPLGGSRGPSQPMPRDGQRGGKNPAFNINLLRDVPEFFGVPANGKLRLDGDEHLLPADTEQGALGAVVARIRSGLHADCPVMFGRSRERGVYSVPPIKAHGAAAAAGVLGAPAVAAVQQWPCVDQIFSASVDLHTVGTKLKSAEARALRELDPTEPEFRMVRPLVRAAYESAYLAAIARHRRQLYLTLVGGGVFGNPIEIIVEEIVRAHRLLANHPASQLENVVVCLYSPDITTHVRGMLKEAGF